MILTIARKEIREILRDGRFVWTAAIMGLLLLAAFATGWQRYSSYQEMQSHAQAQSNDQFYNQGDKNPHSGAHFGNYAFKQAGPLSFFDSGIEAYAGSFIFMEAHKQNMAMAPTAEDQSAIARFGDLNGAMILQVLAPLLIIFLGFSTFAGERERGTLRQLLSIGVSKQQLLWGKALGVASAVGLVIIPCLVLSALVIGMLGVPAGEALGARIGIMALAYLAYLLIFLFFTLAVSAVASTPRTALTILVGFWAFSVFLMPKIAGEISKQIHPSYSQGEFFTSLQETRKKGLGGPPPRARLAMYKKQLLKKYGVTDVADLPVYWVSTSMQKLEEMDHEFYDYYYKGLSNTYLEQRRAQDMFGILDPNLALTSLSAGLAGTDLTHQSRFVDAGEDHRRVMVKKVNSYLSKMAADYNRNIATNDGATTANIDLKKANRVLIAPEEVFRMVKPFEYSPPTLGEVLREYRLSIVLLALWLVASLLAARIAVARLRPQTH